MAALYNIIYTLHCIEYPIVHNMFLSSTFCFIVYDEHSYIYNSPFSTVHIIAVIISSHLQINWTFGCYFSTFNQYRTSQGFSHLYRSTVCIGKRLCT